MEWTEIALQQEQSQMGQLCRVRAKSGFDPRTALEKFDAYPLFRVLGDAIEVGPTGNNLRDLRLLLAY